MRLGDSSTVLNLLKQETALIWAYLDTIWKILDFETLMLF